MPTPRSLGALLALTTLLFLLPTAAVAQKPPAPLDSGLYTNCTIDSVVQNLTWIVCGSTQDTLRLLWLWKSGAFGKIGALIEG